MVKWFTCVGKTADSAATKAQTMARMALEFPVRIAKSFPRIKFHLLFEREPTF